MKNYYIKIFFKNLILSLFISSIICLSDKQTNEQCKEKKQGVSGNISGKEVLDITFDGKDKEIKLYHPPKIGQKNAKLGGYAVVSFNNESSPYITEIKFLKPEDFYIKSEMKKSSYQKYVDKDQKNVLIYENKKWILVEVRFSTRPDLQKIFLIDAATNISAKDKEIGYINYFKLNDLAEAATIIKIHSKQKI